MCVVSLYGCEFFGEDNGLRGDAWIFGLRCLEGQTFDLQEHVAFHGSSSFREGCGIWML